MNFQSFLRTVFCLGLFGSFLTFGAFAQDKTVSLSEAAVRDFVADYYAAYGTGDAAKALALWDASAPDFAARKREIETFLRNYRVSDLRDLKINSASIENDRAEIRVEFRFDAAHPQTGAPSNLPPVARRVLTVRQTGADLKVAGERTVESELAQKIAMAASDAERKKLLAAQPELRNIYLRQALSQQGERLRNEFEYDRSIRIFEINQIVAEEDKDRRGYALAVNNIGITYHRQGLLDRATEFFERALKIRTEMNDETGIALGSYNIGLIYEENGNLPAALDNYNRAIHIAEKIKRREWLAQMLTSKGKIYWKLGDYQQAQQLYDRSAKIYEELNDKNGIAGVWHNTSNLLFEQGNHRAAMEMALKALAVVEPLGNPVDIHNLLIDIGANYAGQGDYRRALEYHERALKIAEETKSSLNLVISLIAVAENRLQLDQPEQALPFIERAVRLAEETANQAMIWHAETRRGEILLRLKNYPAARGALVAAIEKVETMRAQFGDEVDANQFFSSRLVAYRRLLELELAENNLPAALELAERTKARALLDVLALGRVEIDKALTAEEKRRETELGQRVRLLNQKVSAVRAASNADAVQLKKLEAELDQARLDYKTYRTDLYAAYPELRAARGEAQIIKQSEIAAQLAQDATKVFLEYTVTDDATYLFVVSKAKRPNAAAPVDIKVHKIPINAKNLTAKADEFRQIIARRGAYEKPARELYDLLVQPAAKELAGKTKIVVVPDGALWNLPFQALQPKSNRFLLEDYVLSYAPSLTALREMRKIADRKRAVAKTGKTLFAFGNPLYDSKSETAIAVLRNGETLGALPDAEREVNLLANLYGAANSRIYVQAEARENLAKTEARDYRVLQFAAHGVFNDANPMYSYLALAPNQASGDDGLLEARELLDLNLSADLVVLSACETARGRVQNGEGLTGMTWALFVAGVPTTVASQWKVPSEGTAEVMLGFHRNLLKSGKSADKAAALRQSELDFLRGGTYRHPFYWAGFILIGND